MMFVSNIHFSTVALSRFSTTAGRRLIRSRNSPSCNCAPTSGASVLLIKTLRFVSISHFYLVAESVHLFSQSLTHRKSPCQDRFHTSLRFLIAFLAKYTRSRNRFYIAIRLQVCPSYPEAVIVPKGIGDDYLRASASFREDGRFPVLSYYHRDTRVNSSLLIVYSHQKLPPFSV